MPRPNLQEAIKTGLLTPVQLGSLIGVSAPTIRALCDTERIRYLIRPARRKELRIPANTAILDLRRHKYLVGPVPEALVLAARFYIVQQAAKGTPVPDADIPPECLAQEPTT